nr:NADH dehydrogenase subunit 3 [Orientocreadium sp. HS]
MLIFFSCFFLFGFVMLLVLLFHLFIWNYSLRDNFSSRVWSSAFECGFLSQRLVENYFSYTYFILLVFFVVFDLEISLLLNIPFQGQLYKNLFYYFLFLVLLSVGFSLEVNKG